MEDAMAALVVDEVCGALVSWGRCFQFGRARSIPLFVVDDFLSGVPPQVAVDGSFRFRVERAGRRLRHLLLATSVLLPNFPSDECCFGSESLAGSRCFEFQTVPLDPLVLTCVRWVHRCGSTGAAKGSRPQRIPVRNLSRSSGVMCSQRSFIRLFH